MSAGSAFASGVRAGQNIWNQAINNAMAGKRMDMLKTQFEYEQAQRKKQIEDQLAAQEGYEKYLSSIPGNIDFTKKEDREVVEKASSEFFPDIIRDSSVFKQFEAFNKNLGNIGKLELWNKIKNKRDNIEATWLEWNNGMMPPTIDNNGVVETNYNLMQKQNLERERRIDKSKKLGDVDTNIEVKFKEMFPSKQFPNIATDPFTGTESKPDYGAASKMVRDEERKREVDKLVDTADSKNEIEFRIGFKNWQRDVVKNPTLDPKNPEDQKLYRTFAHDEKISGLMAEAGLEAFKLADELVPDEIAGGYKNMAEVTGMINDLMRKQEEDADTKKAMAQKPLTESQAKDYIFSGRLKLTENVIAKLEQDGFKPESIPQDIMMTWLPELAKTEDQKRYIAARANWIAAMLRRESGAAIAESEYKGGFEQYFPLIGDSPQVVRDKRNLRRQVERDMRAIATNQPVMSNYETTGDSVEYDNLNKVKQAVNSGRLKVGDKYKYYDANGLIQDGVVEPGE